MSHHASSDAGDGDADAPQPPPRPGRVAVLGGTGLIGSAVARAFLDAGAEVTVLARRPARDHVAPLLDGATLELGDAADRGAIRRVVDGADHVVDTLGAPHPADSVLDPIAQFGAEIPYLLGVLDEVRRAGDVGFTYVSSGGAIYGNVDVLPVTEEAECRPLSPYGVTKLAAEGYVQIAANTGGVDARILRVANAYGALQRARTGQGLVAACLHAAVTGTTVHVFGDGTSTRDYVDVRDVACAVVALAAAPDRTRVVNVGSGTGHSVADVLATVEAVCGTSLRVVFEPTRASDVRDVVLDVSRLSSIVPWLPIPLERGVDDAWQAWASWEDVEGVRRAAVQ